MIASANNRSNNSTGLNSSSTDSDSGTWPRGVDRDPKFSIGVVVDLVVKEFPATTVSKIRFLEDQGLIKPYRTNSGYRKYSRADVERIRFILGQQRDSYAPLRVIHDQLKSLDAGHDLNPLPVARLIASEGKVVIPAVRTVSARELIDLTGITAEQLEEYVRLGIVVPDLGGHFPTRTVKIISLVVQLSEVGVSARLLRSVRTGAERSADIIDQSVMSRQNRSRPGEKERIRAQATDLAELFGQLHQEFLGLSVEKLSEA